MIDPNRKHLVRGIMRFLELVVGSVNESLINRTFNEYRDS